VKESIHHKLSDRGQRNLGLSDKDAPKLDPMTEIGSGTVYEKQKAYLTEIIEQLNTLFGGETNMRAPCAHVID
jgi:type I restriction enzyme R subunit